MTTSDLRDDAAKLRASDAERTATAELLRRHHAEGRLDTDELEERLECCYAAKTRGELDALTADLPGPRRREPRVPGGHRRGPHVPVGLLAIAAIVALAVTTDAPVLWLIWPLAFFAFGPFRRCHGWRRVP